MLSRVALRPFCLRAGALRPRTQQHRQPGIAAQQLHRGDWHRPAGRRPLRRRGAEQALGGRTEVTGTAMAMDASVPTASGGNIFVYGTLMAEDIVRLLIQRMPEHSPATLAGHRRVRVKDADFPAVIPSFNAAGERADQVEGLGLDETDLTIFDDYEDDDYTRETVTVALPDGSEAVAFVYIWADHVRHKLTSEPWDFVAFRERDMEAYVSRMEGFLDEMRDQWAELRRQQQ